MKAAKKNSKLIEFYVAEQRKGCNNKTLYKTLIGPHLEYCIQ